MEKAILEQLVLLSGQIGELKSEMKQGFKEQNTKIESLHVEMNERFQEQDAKFEKRFQEQDAKFDNFKTEINERFKEQNAKIENGFKEQKQVSEQLRQDLLWNMQDASDIIIGFYNELNNKIHTSYNKLKNTN